MLLFSLLPSLAAPAFSFNHADLAFGLEQLTLMLKDRPAMRAFTNDSFLYAWVSEQFGGKTTGYHIYWTPQTPNRLAPSFNTFDIVPDTSVSSISVRGQDNDGYSVSGERLWAYAVFELLNCRNQSRVRELVKLCIAGTIKKDDYLRGVAKLEFETSKELWKFYKSELRPRFDSEGVNCHDDYWLSCRQATFEEYWGCHPKRLVDNDYFDTQIAPLIKK